MDKCPICKGEIKQRKNDTGTSAIYDCNNDKCPVLKVHAVKRGSRLKVLEVITDSRFTGDLEQFSKLE